MPVETPTGPRADTPDRREPARGAGGGPPRARGWWWLVAALLASGLVVVLVLTAGREAPVIGPTSGGSRALFEVAAPVAPLTAAELAEVAATIDGSIADVMAEHDIPGGVVVVVGDGGIAHAQGYGYTDLARDTPVDAASTRFDIGSVSKLLTATAVMQLAEQGVLDLHADVNTYLTEVQVPEHADGPVTAAHLLTHTGGFAEHYLLGSMAPGPGQVQPLTESLRRFQPERIRPPGLVHQYDNFGMGLAGHLVEAVAGVPFEEHVTETVLAPLGMTRSTYGEAVPDAVDVVPHEAVPGLGVTGAVPHEYVNMLPTGGLWTTGEDIASFMLAHLGGGAFDGARILEADTVAEMHRTQFAPHPDVAGVGYGFFEHRAGERHGVQHGGSWVGASAHLYLLPDADLGLFVAFNHGAGVEFTHTLIHDAVERAVPVVRVTDATSSVAGADVDRYAGHYRWNRHDRTTFMRLVSTLTVPRMQVTAADDGSLTTSMSPVRLLPDTSWDPVGDDVFVEQGGTTTLAFFHDDGGAVAGLHVSGAQLLTMDRLAWYQTTAFTLGSTLLFLLAALTAAIGWPAGALLRRMRRRHRDTPTEVRRARRLAGLAGGLLVAFFLGIAGYFALDMAGLLAVGAGVQALLVLPLVSAVLTVALAFVVVRLWRTGSASTAGRVYLTGLSLTLLAFLPLLAHLRLLGFHH